MSETKSQPTVLRKRPRARERINADIEMRFMIEAVNRFLDREGDRHFNPDVFDQICERWNDTGVLLAWEVTEVRELYQRWCAQ